MHEQDGHTSKKHGESFIVQKIVFQVLIWFNELLDIKG